MIDFVGPHYLFVKGGKQTAWYEPSHCKGKPISHQLNTYIAWNENPLLVGCSPKTVTGSAGVLDYLQDVLELIFLST